MKTWTLRVGAAALLVVTGLAVAQPDTRDDELRRLFREATELAEAGQLDEARQLYLEIWKQHRTYDTALNLSQIAYANGDHATAAEYARFGLEEFPPSENGATHQHFKNLYRDAREQVGTIKIEAPPGSEVRVDGEIVGPAPVPEAFVPVGEHEVVASDGVHLASQTVTTAKGEVIAVSLEFDAMVGTVEPAAGAATADGGAEPVAPRRPQLVPIVVGGGVALIGAGMGVGFALRASTKRDAAEAIDEELVGDSACGGSATSPRCDRLDELWTARDRAANAATWSFIVGGAAATATVTYALWPRPRRERTVGVSPQLNGLVIHGRF